MSRKWVSVYLFLLSLPKSGFAQLSLAKKKQSPLHFQLRLFFRDRDDVRKPRFLVERVRLPLALQPLTVPALPAKRGQETIANGQEQLLKAHDDFLNDRMPAANQAVYETGLSARVPV